MSGLLVTYLNYMFRMLELKQIDLLSFICEYHCGREEEYLKWTLQGLNKMLHSIICSRLIETIYIAVLQETSNDRRYDKSHEQSWFALLFLQYLQYFPHDILRKILNIRKYIIFYTTFVHFLFFNEIIAICLFSFCLVIAGNLTWSHLFSVLKITHSTHEHISLVPEVAHFTLVTQIPSIKIIKLKMLLRLSSKFSFQIVVTFPLASNVFGNCLKYRLLISSLHNWSSQLPYLYRLLATT